MNEVETPTNTTDQHRVGRANLHSSPEGTDNTSTVADGSADAPLNSVATNIYNGPVINIAGNQAQLSWEDVRHPGTRNEQTALDFEQLASSVLLTMRNLHSCELGETDLTIAESTGRDVLEEAARPEPNSGRIQRGLAALRALLGPLATGAAEGAEEGARELARTAVGQLNSLI
ncbi:MULTISPECIES: hypothetical protein [unclassified Saccharopolyspora]|uniref:hypothetical protein n=1 Tax=unclassified Saccharopolyspora TaxID=2646250 RepID=UPI001CD37A85|nr:MULTISPECIES: hypothetical protein [unclassified Saccharopolyspora]MCA1186184.1 hypothetical protein [Saccharopolyspora sp. 6T]MCA1278387.1 hypothetical protein [Saccharopolyspora sp. 7B]